MKITNTLNTRDFRHINTFALKNGDAFISEKGNFLYIYVDETKEFVIFDLSLKAVKSTITLPNCCLVRRVDVELVITEPK